MEIETLNLYQTMALKTLKTGMSDEQKIFYLTAKLSEEVGEFSGPIAKNIVHGKPLPKDHAVGELGDLLYYVAAAADFYGLSLQEVAEFNIAKLAERHGDAYRASYYAQNEADRFTYEDKDE